MKKYKFTIRGNEYQVQINSFEDSIAEVDVNGTIYQVELEQEVKTTKTPKFVRSKPIPTQETKPEPALRLSKVTAPLPGTILKLNVKEGDTVKKGDVLLIMEAMKMENNIMAEVNGVVKSLKIKELDNVLQGDILIEIE